MQEQGQFLGRKKRLQLHVPGPGVAQADGTGGMIRAQLTVAEVLVIDLHRGQDPVQATSIRVLAPAGPDVVHDLAVLIAGSIRVGGYKASDVAQVGAGSGGGVALL